MTGYKFIGTGLLCLMLAGCGSTPVPDPEPTENDAAADGRDGSSSGMAGEEFGRGEEFGDDVAQGELGMIIYFDFDQSDLRPEYADLLARHAANLANNSGTTVRLEGHADERGSREYNIGLGERRSQAVRRMLLIQGATAEQISTVSFGEERPAAMGSDDESYAQNRRVEIKYIN
ncbi:MAG TPA: peptidoglycan-associated lipoprotein Pal [Woeseiaceae bacterium]|nr:peptidoglycan-associated lipoprotein Pal [Woeseiaceae bacterium]